MPHLQPPTPRKKKKDNILERSKRKHPFLTKPPQKNRVIATSALQLHHQAQKQLSPNPTLDGVAATICRQTEIFYAIMASTIPCLRPFLASFFTGFGAMGGETVIAGSQVGSGSGSGGNSRGEKGGGSGSAGSGSYALGSMQSSSGDSSSAAAAATAAGRKNKRRSGQTTVGAYVAGQRERDRERDRDHSTVVGSGNRLNRALVVSSDNELAAAAAAAAASPRAKTSSSFSTAAAAANNNNNGNLPSAPTSPSTSPSTSKHNSTMMTMMGAAGPAGADALSIASNESQQKMIIKKEVQWCVDSEEKGASGVGVGVPRGF